MAKITAHELFTQCLTPTRDLDVKEAILNFFEKNKRAMMDGYVTDVITIGTDVRNSFERHYGVTGRWKEVSNNPEIKLSSEAAKPLRMGLIDSYIRTGDRIYILFLFVLLFSARLRVYFRTGIDPKRMKYTLEYKVNNNSDFKKYKSLINIMNKKVDVYLNTYHKSIMKKTDREYRLGVVNAYNRVNDLVKNLAGQYPYKNDEFVMLEQSSLDADGKSLISQSSVMEEINNKAKNSLQSVSVATLNSIGLPLTPENEGYINFIKWSITSRYDDMCFLVDTIMDEWRKRHPSAGLETMIKTFGEMRSARGMKHYHDRIEKMFKMYKNLNKDIVLNSFNAKKYLCDYVVVHVHRTALEVYTNK